MADVVLITGASEGIGRATAFTFARGGYRLALAARTAETLRQTAIELEQSLNAEVLAVPTDVTQPEQVQNLVERTLERYGRIDCLINNAGICLKGPFLQTTLEHWQALMAVNFWGYLYTIRAVLPDMLKRKKGQIINVGSVGGKMPLPQMSAYCASKYAVSGLTEALRLELQPHGIQVIGVHPGIVSSNFLKRAIFLDEGGGRSPLPMANRKPQVGKPASKCNRRWRVFGPAGQKKWPQPFGTPLASPSRRWWWAWPNGQ